MPESRPARRLPRFRWAHGGAALCALTMAVSALARPALAQNPVSVNVEVRGVDGAVEDNVRAVLAIARAAGNGPLSRARVERLHDRAEEEIRLALQPFGYYRPAIAKSLLRSGDDDWTARYEIDAGPAVRVRRVDVRVTGPGADLRPFRQAVDSFPVRSGDQLSHLAYETGKAVFLNIASDSGYLGAGFDTSLVLVNRDESRADLNVEFATGPRFRFGPVRFEQNVLDADFLRTRVPFEQGDPWRQDLVLELQTRLAEDRYFGRVEVIPEVDQADSLEVPIRVILEPRPPIAYEAGLGYGSETGPRGRFQTLFRRINRSGHFADAELVLATKEQRVSASYMIPAVGHPVGLLTFQGGFARLDPGPSTSRAIVVQAQLARPRFGWRETLSLGFQRESFRIGVDTGLASLLVAGGAWERTRSNSWLFPTRGIRSRISLQGSGSGLLGSVALFRADFGVKGIYAPANGVRVHGNLDVGRLFTSDFRALPPTLRFFAGGDQSVRGYEYQGLGPRDSLNNVIGGRSVVTGSAELDLRVLSRWVVAGFVDAGNAFREIDLGDLEYGVGGGLRFLAPIGMIRLDLAFAVSQPGAPVRLHFSIGPDL